MPYAGAVNGSDPRRGGGAKRGVPTRDRDEHEHRDAEMTLQDALMLFRRLGVDPQALSPSEFSAAYYRLARRYHPDVNPNTPELMANINAARSLILRSSLPS